MSIILDGLIRALKTVPDRYGFICKLAKKHLRDYVANIFLLKRAEKNIKDNELKIKREEGEQEDLKRDASGIKEP